MLGNISGEQGLDTAINMTTSGAGNAFRFARWIIRHIKGVSGRKSEQAGKKSLELRSDACSAYRGGYVKHGDDKRLAELIRSLAGTDDVRLGGNFIFLGDRTDLSLFWRKSETGRHCLLPKDRIDAIPDAKLRSKVTASMAKAQLDGLVAFDGKHYALTEKGRLYVLNTDFISSRLKAECKFFGLAADELQREAHERTQDRIDARLSELGIDNKYDGCERITLNKEKLFRAESGEAYSFYVPGTGRNMSVEIPKDHVIDLDSKTYAAFIPSDMKFTATERGRKRAIDGAELFSHYQNKSKVVGEDLASAVDRAEAAAKKEPSSLAPQKSFDADDFFAAALNRSYGGRDFFAAEKISAAYAPKEGEVYTVFSAANECADYVITRTWEDELGTKHYNLAAADGSSGDILLPEEAFGEIVFADKAEGTAYLEAHPDRAAELTDKLLVDQLPAAEEQSVSYSVPGEWCHTEGDNVIITPEGREYVRIEIPHDEVSVERGGRYRLDLSADKIYNVYTGKEGVYTAEQNGRALGRTLGKSAAISKETGKAAVSGVSAAATSVSTTGAGVSATATGGAVAAAVIPPVEPVTATVKTVLTAASKAAQTASTAASVGSQATSLTRSL